VTGISHCCQTHYYAVCMVSAQACSMSCTHRRLLPAAASTPVLTVQKAEILWAPLRSSCGARYEDALRGCFASRILPACLPMYHSAVLQLPPPLCFASAHPSFFTAVVVLETRQPCCPPGPHIFPLDFTTLEFCLWAAGNRAIFCSLSPTIRGACITACVPINSFRVHMHNAWGGNKVLRSLPPAFFAAVADGRF
jgi:hypothetical protein